MGEREKILEDLKRWAQQQRKAGVERVVLDAELAAAAAAAALPRGDAAPSGEPPADDAAAPLAAAPAPKRAQRRATSAAAEPLLIGDDAAPALPDAADDPTFVAKLHRRHPAWKDTDMIPLALSVEACRNCGLGACRDQSVPGTGNPRAKLVFVGEAPGAEEDRQGIPFVGRAGQLLDKILAAIEMKREDVHILNILKCRPPDNRNPAPDEIEACRPFLERQIDIIQPGVLVALGLFAAQWLTGKKLSLTKLRETGPYVYRGIPVYATYHPAALLRNPNWKRPAWADFQVIQREVNKL